MTSAIVFYLVTITFAITTVGWAVALDRAVRRERAAMIKIVGAYKPLSPNPDVVYTKRAILAAISKRNLHERAVKNQILRRGKTR